MKFTKEDLAEFFKKYKIGIGFAIPMTIFYLIQGFILLNEYSFNSISRVLLSSLAAGALSGFIFNFIMNLFKNSKFVKKTTVIKLNENETVLLEENANHFKGLEAVGGRIYITNSRVIFKSHSLNIQNHEVSFLWDEIESTSRYKSLGLVNNGLELHLKNNKNEKFVIENIEAIILEINKHIVA